ncbi:zinc-dependent alcohol dehydrogenase family protein [Streptomyces sp. NPDC058691]|uniref:zinc-dependent alcohol dehydrogenase family protein n=1 Tax=Streptomyces sp. NPDC058691 TaxID=3346601 RepID=UPI00364EEE84
MTNLTLSTVGGDLGETVSLTEGAASAPGPDEVLVAVDAAPVNPADFLYAAGWFGVYPQVPAAMGAEGAGRVTRVGDGVDPALVGKRVIILPTFEFGTWADQVVVPAAAVIAVTERADAAQLAMLPVNPATAWALLHDYVELKPGDWVGVTLANSAVGQHVIALAKRAGLRTLAVVRREEAAQQVRERGADAVVIDGEDLAEQVARALDGQQLRLLLEGTGGADQLGRLVGSVEAGGSVVAFSAATAQPPVLPLGDLIYRGISLRSFFILTWLRETPRTELERVYNELAELIVDGVLETTVAGTYPLARYRDALTHAAGPERSGKVVFVPEHPAA